MSQHDDIEAHLAQGLAEGWSPRTAIRYRSELERLVRFLADRGVTRWPAVTQAHLHDLMQAGIDARWASKTCRHFAGTLHAFFARLHADGRILRNPAIDLPLPDRRQEALPPAPLSQSEVDALFAGIPRSTVIDLRNRLHLELLYGCGLRIAESVALDLDDVDLQRRTLHIRHGKGGQERVLPLMNCALAAFKDYRSLRRTLLRGPDHGALFLNHLGGRLAADTFRQWLRRHSQRTIGRRVNPHLLRHSVAVHLLRGGTDIRHIQHFLGHADLDTTKIYLRLVPGQLPDDYHQAMPTLAITL